MLKIDSICNVAKSFKTARKKNAGLDAVRCTLKFTECPIDRNLGDELLGMPVGWLTSTHYDEQGAPLKCFTLSNRQNEFRVTGRIKGIQGESCMTMLQVDLTDVEITLQQNLVHLDGVLSWDARGDEVEDLVALLGKTCNLTADVHNAEQQELPLRAKPAEGSNVLPFGGRGEQPPAP